MAVLLTGRISILTFVFASNLLQAEEKRPLLRVGSNFDVPMSYLLPDGTQAGFIVDVMREAARREGLQLEIVLRRDRFDAALQSGDIDIWAAAVDTPERRRNFYFTEPWWSFDHYLAVAKTSSLNSIGDFAGRTVLYAPSPPLTANLQELLPGAKLTAMANLRDRFLAVCENRADAVLFYPESGFYSLVGSKDLLECRERGLRFVPIPQPLMKLSIASLPENKAFADRMRRSLAKMAADHTMEKLGSLRVLGDQKSLSLMFETERATYQQRILLISLGSLSGLILLIGIAHVRLRRANARTVAALAVATRAERVKSEFLATMSHEIRTPMTAVLGYMEMLLATGLRHDQRQFANEVCRATNSLLTILTTVLDYSRSLGGKQPVVKEEFDLTAVVEDSIAALLLEAEAKGLTVTVQLDPAIPSRLMGDPARMRHMILNLAANAVKFTEQGWVHVAASYRVTGAETGVAEIAVSDSGVGIAKDKQELIFMPFTQVNFSDSRPAGGIGLGLAIVSEAAKHLGGSVALQSQPGVGSTFTLKIPVEQAAHQPGWLEEWKQSNHTEALIVARASRQIDILESYLNQAGFKVKRVESFPAAHAWLTASARAGNTFCFVEGDNSPDRLSDEITQLTALRGHGPLTFVLVGSMSYLGGAGSYLKPLFGAVLPLPVCKRSLSDVLLPPSQQNGRYPQLSQRVLVVDDNSVNRRVLEALLAKLGCQVDLARGGREALELATRNQYDLVLMDLQMPEMDGYETTQSIRRDSTQGAAIPICGLSAAVDPGIRDKCLRAGMNDYLPKPVTLDHLRDLLQLHCTPR